MTKIKPLPPVKVKVNLWNYIKRVFLGILLFVLTIILFVTGVHILSYYIFSVINNGLFAPETLKFAVYLVIGAYLCLILDKSKIYEAMDIKKNLSFITIEQIEQTTTKKDSKERKAHLKAK